jgi:hypothetical protein
LYKSHMEKSKREDVLRMFLGQHKILDSRSLIMVQLARNSNRKGGYNHV